MKKCPRITPATQDGGGVLDAPATSTQLSPRRQVSWQPNRCRRQTWRSKFLEYYRPKPQSHLHQLLVHSIRPKNWYRPTVIKHMRPRRQAHTAMITCSSEKTAIKISYFDTRVEDKGSFDHHVPLIEFHGKYNHDQPLVETWPVNTRGTARRRGEAVSYLPRPQNFPIIVELDYHKVCRPGVFCGVRASREPCQYHRPVAGHPSCV